MTSAFAVPQFVRIRDGLMSKAEIDLDTASEIATACTVDPEDDPLATKLQHLIASSSGHLDGLVTFFEWEFDLELDVAIEAGTFLLSLHRMNQ